MGKKSSLTDIGVALALVGSVLAIVITIIWLLDISLQGNFDSVINAYIGITRLDSLIILVLAVVLFVIVSGRVKIEDELVLAIVVFILGALIGNLGGLLAVLGALLIFIDAITT